MDPSKDLSLEEGETIYENKWVFEWIILGRLLLLLAIFPLYWMINESYSTNTTPSPEYLSRFTVFIHPMNSAHRGLPKRIPETLNYWGTNMWLWQHWVRKGLLYTGILLAGLYLRKGFKIGTEYVTKAVYNRERDLVFIWKPTGYLYKQVHVYELHYLEQTVPKVTSGWKDLGNFQKDGVFCVHDLRLDHELIFYNESKFWNVDQREHFMKNTNTFWKDLRHKDVDRGIFINNSRHLTEEEAFTTKKINEEVKNAIEKHGPLMLTDYEYNYKYQLKKRIQEIKKNLIEGKPVDTSMYREKNAGISHDSHGDELVKHAMH
jgi:hypothetical protein